MKKSEILLALAFVTMTPFAMAQEESSYEERMDKEYDERYARTQETRNVVSEERVQNFDAYFYYSTKANGQNLDISAYSIPDKFGSQKEQYAQALNLFQAALGMDSARYSKATSYAESLQLLKRESLVLSRDQKLLFLSLSGSYMSQFYSESVKNRGGPEELFSNALESGTQGGICGDIHQFLAGQAQALGFKDIGMHTGLWQKDKAGKDSGGHFVYHFKDPATGLYYIQNYSQIIATGQKTQQGMLEVSSRILGPLSGVVYSQGVSGNYHYYLPKTAAWIKNGLSALAYKDVKGSVLRMQVGPQEKSVQIQTVAELQGSYVRAFALHQQFNANEGNYRFSAVGVSGQVGGNFVVKSVVDEVGLFINGYGGIGQVGSPALDSIANWDEKRRTVLFHQLKFKGTARINNTTGRVELERTNLDTSLIGMKRGSRADIVAKFGIEQVLTSGFTVDYERTVRRVKDGYGSTQTKWATEADKVSVVFDKQAGKVYLVVRGELFLFEGVENMSATAVKNSIEASVPVGHLGQVYVKYDLAKMVKNQSNDPFYDLPASQEFRLGIKRDFAKLVQSGVEVSYAKGYRAYPLHEDAFTPELQSENVKGRWQGNIWVSLRW
ncbi:hypothetical protein [Bdellovibrio bacteriovorus]|uniref:Uncharacterized protein n=1 Tax=Bdellovibrio bacteriovorus str. Tiberius TaxID=1069642 RepID=K7ZES4_BDEBC|nr:hypothetical protein [Bdellovibrio bacteriovorus]AFY00787.1 Hypothetical protein Bdt_1087 [Bdellovibrio bacteriovorus str. Tiberius]